MVYESRLPNEPVELPMSSEMLLFLAKVKNCSSIRGRSDAPRPPVHEEVEFGPNVRSALKTND